MSGGWQGTRVFITGATGFVGSWLSDILIESGAEVTILVRDIHPRTLYFTRNVGLVPKNIVIGDITNYKLVSRIFDEYEIDSCFHLAAQAIVRVANRSPLSTFESNIKGTWNILEAARNSKTLRQMVVASTDKVYGEPIKVPITEDHPLLASHPYDASKACADILARTYFKTHGLPVAVSRCSNIYGGRDLNFSRIVPDTIRSILLDRRPTIRSDGTPIRDYLYITDVTSAYLCLGENVERSEVKGEAFNFGTGKPVRVMDLVKKILHLARRDDLKPVILGKPSKEISVQYLSSEKANSILNWHAKVLLDDGLEETIKWYHENMLLWANKS